MAINLQYESDYVKNLAGKEKSYKITRTKMLSTHDKANPDKKHIIGLHLAAVKLMTVQVATSKLPL